MSRLPQVLLNGVQLDDQSLNGDDFEEAVLTEIMRQTSTLQKALFRGELKDQDSVLDFLMGQPNVMPRLNDRVLSTNNKYLDMTGTGNADESDLKSLSSKDLIARFSASVKYITSAKAAGSLTPLTIWLALDVTGTPGRTLLQNTIDHIRNSRLIRLALVHNVPSVLTDGQKHYVDVIDSVAASSDFKLLEKLLKEDNAKAIIKGTKTGDSFGVSVSETDFELDQIVASRALNLQPGQRVLIINGRIVGPLEDGEDFTQDDVALLEKHTMSAAGEKILQLFQDLPNLHSSDLVMKVASLLLTNPSSKTRHSIDDFNSRLSLLTFPPKFEDSPFIDIVAIADPVSTGAQKLAPLLLVLQEVLNCRIRLFLNPVEKHSEMPLKSFYRLVLEPDLLFSSDERLLAGPIAKFGVLPMGALLTQNFQVPDNWMVESVWSPYDLDNIRLENVDTDIHSEYELEHLLLEGHCFDQATGSPPRGLQLTLGTLNDPVKVDTIVMANLGYLQLKV